MKAFVYHGPGLAAWEDKPRPTLEAATDAIVRITHTALCWSDLPVIRGAMNDVPDGVTLGHEAVGLIEDAGSDVSAFAVGDRVMMSYPPPCGECGPCRRKAFSECANGGWTLGRLVDGTMAEYARIPHANRALQHVPAGLDAGTLMTLRDILPTGIECAVPDGQIRPGSTVAIFGSGPLGLTALLMAQFHSPAEIIMVDSDRHRLEAAAALGATGIVHATGGDAIASLMQGSGTRKIDVAIVANANVALNSIWMSYGQPALPLRRVLLMPSRRMCA